MDKLVTYRKLMSIERTPVDSSQIKAIGYYEGYLIVEFNSGVTWAYSPIVKKTYLDLMNAESKGKFFNSEIKKNQNLTAQKISE